MANLIEGTKFIHVDNLGITKARRVIKIAEEDSFDFARWHRNVTDYVSIIKPGRRNYDSGIDESDGAAVAYSEYRAYD